MRELSQEELDTVLAAGLSDSRSGKVVGQVADSLAKVVRLLA
jgi:hypothetical protein